jgi:acid phosphatase family membrane protein YuiD
MCKCEQETDKLEQEFRVIDFTLSTVANVASMPQNHSAVVGVLATGKLAETIGNLTEMLLLASARAKKLHEDLE